MSATPKNIGFGNIFGSSAPQASVKQPPMSRFATIKPQVPPSLSRTSQKIMVAPSTNILPPMPVMNARPDIKPEIKRASTAQMMDKSSEIDTFKDRDFVVGETLEEWLDSCIEDIALKKVLMSLSEVAFKEISDKIKEAATNK